MMRLPGTTPTTSRPQDFQDDSVALAAIVYYRGLPGPQADSQVVAIERVEISPDRGFSDGHGDYYEGSDSCHLA